MPKLWTREHGIRLQELTEKSKAGEYEKPYLTAFDSGIAHIYEDEYVNPEKPDCFASDAEVDEFIKLKRRRTQIKASLYL